MGSELYLMYCPAPRFSNEEVVTDFDMIRKEVRTRLDNIPLKTLDEICNDTIVDPTLYPDDYNSLAEIIMNELEQFVIDLSNFEFDLFLYLANNVFTIPLVFAGGLSWEDTTTDHWNIVEFISESGLFDEPFDL